MGAGMQSAFDFADKMTPEIERLLDGLVASILKKMRDNGDTYSQAEALRVFDDVLGLIDERGGTLVLNELDDATVEIARSLVGPELDLASIADEIETVLEATKDEVTNQLLATASSARRMALSLAAGVGDYESSLAALTAELNTTKARAVSAAWTGLAGVHRSTTVALAPPDAVFLYEGVRDAKLRPFCARFVGKAYTKAYLNAHNDDPQRKGQPDPVTTYCGGYNCRHSLSALTRDEAEALGVEVVG